MDDQGLSDRIGCQGKQVSPQGSWMIKAHPTENRMPRRATPVVATEPGLRRLIRLGLLWRVADGALGLLRLGYWTA
jgi:hypothetical protein